MRSNHVAREPEIRGISTDLSVVVPIYNEEENVDRLVARVQEALTDRFRWELVLVDDGSSDATAEHVRSASLRDARVRLVRLARNYGQSTATQAGFDHARGNVVVTMDGDLQNDPEDIPSVLAKLGEGYDLVAGYRVRRKDRLIMRKVPSWIANRIIAFITGVPIRDNGCSLKAYRRALIQRTVLYSDLHRFIPALAVGAAGARIAQIPVRHHPRTHGVSKYGISRVVKVLADLLTIKMIQSFRMQPLRLAGGGCLAFLTLAALFGVLALTRSLGTDGASTTVYTGASLVFGSLSTFLLLLGLVAEVAVRHRRGKSGQPPPMIWEWSS